MNYNLKVLSVLLKGVKYSFPQIFALVSAIRPQMAQLEFFCHNFSYHFMPRPGFEPTPVELHQTGAFWRMLYQLSYRAAGINRLDKAQLEVKNHPNNSIELLKGLRQQYKAERDTELDRAIEKLEAEVVRGRSEVEKEFQDRIR